MTYVVKRFLRQSWQECRLPDTSHTVPDVRFSRIRFLGYTRFRVGLVQRARAKTFLLRQLRFRYSYVF